MTDPFSSLRALEQNRKSTKTILRAWTAFPALGIGIYRVNRLR